MKWGDRLAEEAAGRKTFTGWEVIVIACFLPFLSAMLTFGGAHPLVHAFSDPTSDRIGPWIGVIGVGLFWAGTLWFWAWEVRWYVRRRRADSGD